LTGARITKHEIVALNATGTDVAVEELVLSIEGIEIA
jgi:hypothetical protein